MGRDDERSCHGGLELAMADYIFSSENVTIETAFRHGAVVAVYFRHSSEKIARTVETEVPDVFVDLDAQDRIVGIEMINPAAVTLKKVFKKLGQQFKIRREAMLPAAKLDQIQELIGV